MTKRLKSIVSSGVMTVAAVAIAAPASAQPIPPIASQACLQRTAEAMVVPARELEVTGAGRIDATTGVRTLSMRNTVTGQTADCRVNTIDGTVLSVTLTSQPSRPPQSGGVPQASINACIQQTAEAMVVQAREIQMVEAGPANGLGERTLFMRNTVTGQTAECRVNTTTNQVLSVRLTSQPNRPPQGVTQPAINACITRTAEEFVVPAREIVFVSAGPINAENGVSDLTMRHQPTGRTATCRVSTITNEVIFVRTAQTQPTPPTQGRPVSPNDPLARNCQTTIGNRIRRDFAGVQKLNFLSDTTRKATVSNTISAITGKGQFYQRNASWFSFDYNCQVNVRNGQVTSSSYRVLR